ncbi:MAG: Spy/CpxP family protein refolding chaperone [Proteobacteria bacterium]|nr:Spy/CpxP family protein refolding chaperone [Pseudomonadota bacterium]
MKFLSAVLLFSTLLASPLYGQHSYFDFEKGLKLSEVQRTAVEDIKRKYMDEWRASGREVIKKRLELRDLYRNPSLNRDRVEKLQNEILEIEISRENLYNQYKGEISRILNEEQREKYDSFCGSERKRSMRPLGLRGYGR